MPDCMYESDCGSKSKPTIVTSSPVSPACSAAIAQRWVGENMLSIPTTGRIERLERVGQVVDVLLLAVRVPGRLRTVTVYPACSRTSFASPSCGCSRRSQVGSSSSTQDDHAAFTGAPSSLESVPPAVCPGLVVHGLRGRAGA